MTIQMKRSISTALWLLALLTVACTGEHTPVGERPSPTPETTAEAVPISLSLEASLDEQALGAMSFEVESTGPKMILPEKDIKSIVAIANKDKTKVYYAEIMWKKTKGINHLSYKGKITDLETGTELELDPSQEWYMMGYLGGNYDKSNKRVNFNPNSSTALKAVSVGETLEMTVPIFFSWSPLNVTAQRYGENKNIAFRPLGVMMRVELTNENEYDVLFKSIIFDSYVLSTSAGYYDLNASTLPNVPSSPATTSASAPWVSTTNQEPNYTFANNSGSALKVIVKAGNTYPRNFLVWGMPHESTDSRKRNITHLRAHAVRLETDREIERPTPKMEQVYIWGSTQMPQNGTRRLLKASLLRVKQPLEYFSTNYVSMSPTSNGTGSPIAKSDNSDIGLFAHDQIAQVEGLINGYGWHVPTPTEADGLFHAMNKWLRFDKSNDGPHHNDVNVKVNGSTSLYRDTYYNYNHDIYGLRFQKSPRDDGSRHDLAQHQPKYISAWKYGYTAGQNARIESVYLGKHYKGDIQDILQPSFWALHTPDYISRRYITKEIKDKVGPTIRYNLAATWSNGKVGTNERVAWAWGVPNASDYNGPYMTAMITLDKNKLEAGETVYHDVLMPIIAVEYPGSPLY